MSAGQVTKHCKFEIQCKRACAISTGKSHHTYNMFKTKLDDGWPESEKTVFQAALSMVVVKNSR